MRFYCRTPQVLSETLGGSGDAAPEAPKAVENIHSEHSDWVTQVCTTSPCITAVQQY